ncbi:MAG: hypothetical protein ABR563_09310 [Pyrinomonadaceae bacterium]
MTRRNQARNLLTALFAVFVAVVFAGADFVALAQNDNGNTAQSNTNAGTTNMGRRRRGRRGARRRGNMNANMGGMNANTGDNTNAAAPEASANTNDNTSGAMGNMNMGMGRRGRRGRRGHRGAAASTGAMPTDTTGGAMQTTGGGMGMGTAGTDADLSGTYTGTVNAPDMNLSGPATLTITGNNFTLDAGGNQQTGTMTAKSWPGQIAASLRFGTQLPAQIVSVRAKRMGASGLSLTSVKGETHSFSFTTSGGGRMGRRRGRRGAMTGMEATPPAADTSGAAPTETTGTGTMTGTGTRGRRGRRGRRRGSINMGANDNTMAGNANDMSGTTNTGEANANMTGGNTNTTRRGSRRGTRRGRGGNMNANSGNANNGNTPPPSN